jgi:NAD(P)-dependent dehydrogenase (short-subunit alcohol dehydrogenase family)
MDRGGDGVDTDAPRTLAEVELIRTSSSVVEPLSAMNHTDSSTPVAEGRVEPWCNGTMIQVDLTGRRAIVTGGGRGIGRALALGLAQNGAELAIVFHQNTEAAEQTASAVRALGRRAIAVRADTSDQTQVAGMLASVLEQLGDIDILVNNAGILSRFPFLELPFDEWQRVLRTNLDGYFLVGQAVARHMVAAHTRGCIVNVTSGNQSALAPNGTHYVVSKTGAWALTRQMALELAPFGIRVNALAPGLTETDLNRIDLANPECRQARLERIPLDMLGEPEDQVGALLYLVSDAARYVTGTAIVVDGGGVLLGPMRVRR